MTGQEFSSTRASMVASQLRTNDVSDPRITEAFLRVEREQFVPANRSSIAYTDLPIPLGGKRALNAPLSTARLIAQIMPKPTDRVLLVGAATGYSAAVLSEMGCSVTALEDDAVLATAAKANLARHSSVTLVTAPLAGGWHEGAPYDVIIIDGAIEILSTAIIDQCAEGGRIATAVIDGGVVRLASGYKRAGSVALIAFAECQSAALPGFAPAKEFVF